MYSNNTMPTGVSMGGMNPGMNAGMAMGQQQMWQGQQGQQGQAGGLASGMHGNGMQAGGGAFGSPSPVSSAF